MVLGAITAIGLSACQDSATDPMVGLVAPESEAALALGMAFSDPGGWVEEGSLDRGAERALGDWRDSWLADPDEGRAERAATYEPLAEALAARLGPRDVDAKLDLLAKGVRRARGIGSQGLPSRLSERIDAAGTSLSAALAARDRGDARAAIEEVLRGGDALREVGPEAVARALDREVQEGFRRLRADESYSEQDLVRIRRLVDGARDALSEGSWVLAIRRAYYARALLRGRY